MPEIENIAEIIDKKILANTVKERRFKGALKEYQIIYDSPTETLEPIYFWILNFTSNLFGGNIEKLVDNFISSPGSGHFSELSQKKTILQENIMKNLGAINQVIKTIVNIIYDLKDFEIRLANYDDANSKEETRKEAGLLALKQIWMDNVDIRRGVGSINQLTAGNLQFVTLRDAFLVAKSVEDVEKIDINDRVKRILKPRISEFFEWRKLSEKELRNRFEIEKNYLRSQVNTLRLYSRWIKPYLKHATELEMGEKRRSPELVTTFNTLVLELTLLAKKEVNVEEEIIGKELPKGIKIPKRKYYSVILFNFHFRGIPQKAGQHYAMGGRVIVDFKAYALNENELKLLDQEIAKSEITDVMKWVEGSTTESLDQMEKDITHFLEDKEKKKEEKKTVDINPFTALFSGIFKKEEKKEEEEKIIDIKKVKKDSYSESVVRQLAANVAIENCYTVYDIYKKAHAMLSHDNPFE